MKFSVVHSRSLGHFILETEVLDFRLRQSKTNLNSVILYTQRQISNKYFLSLLKDHYRVLRWPIGKLLHFASRTFSLKQRIFDKVFNARAQNYTELIYENRSVFISDYRLSQLKQHKISHSLLTDSQYAILAARDHGYDIQVKEKIENHTHRITPISSFFPYTNFSRNKNMRFIRVGRHNIPQLNLEKNNIYEIDELKCKKKELCDFSVYQGAKFAISTGFGVDEIGFLLRVPTIYVNFSSFGLLSKNLCLRFILASDFYDHNGNRMSLKKVVKNSFHIINPTPLIEKNIIRIVPKSEQLIFEFVKIAVENLAEKNPESAMFTMNKLGLGEIHENVLY